MLDFTWNDDLFYFVFLVRLFGLIWCFLGFVVWWLCVVGRFVWWLCVVALLFGLV